SVMPKRAAINIVDAYGDATKSDDEATLSAVDLAQMKSLSAALNDLGDALVPLVKDELRVLARAREDARTFANFDSIDLDGYVEALKTRFTTSILGDGGKHRKLMAAAD